MADNELVITRIFDAPRELVWRAFTDPDELAQWFGPVGWSVPRDTVQIELKVGGRERFTMVNDADASMTSPVNAVFTEVVEHELLVGAETFEGPNGTATMTARMEFSDEPDGRTRLVLRQGPFPPEFLGNAREGWGSSFTKLDALLAKG